MNDSKYEPTLCVGADVHLDEIVLRAVHKSLGHEALERFRATSNLPYAQLAATTSTQAATVLSRYSAEPCVAQDRLNWPWQMVTDADTLGLTPNISDSATGDTPSRMPSIDFQTLVIATCETYVTA